jgi:hypothetical protein
MGQTREQRIIKQISGVPIVQKKTPIMTGMFLPNHSGDHSAGKVNSTPVNDLDIVNKKYVDDADALLVPYTGATGDVDLGTHDLTTTGIVNTSEIDFAFSGSNYKITDRQEFTLAFEGTLSASSFGAAYEFYETTGDASRNNWLRIFGKGTSTQISNLEILESGFENTNDKFFLRTNYGGTHTERDLEIYTFSNRGQLDLHTDGSITINGDLYFDASGSGLPYGELEYHDGGTNLVMAAQDTYYQFTGFDTNGESNLTTPDHTNDHITIAKTGIYMVNLMASVRSTTVVDWELATAVNNGATIHAPNIHFTSAAGGKGVNVHQSHFISLTAGDTIEVWGQRTNLAGASQTLTFDSCDLNVLQIGG